MYATECYRVPTDSHGVPNEYLPIPITPTDSQGLHWDSQCMLPRATESQPSPSESQMSMNHSQSLLQTPNDS